MARGKTESKKVAKKTVTTRKAITKIIGAKKKNVVLPKKKIEKTVTECLPEIPPAPVAPAPAAGDKRRTLSYKVLQVIDTKLGRRANQVRIGKIRSEIAVLLEKLDEMLQKKAIKPNDRRILKHFTTEELLEVIKARQE